MVSNASYIEAVSYTIIYYNYNYTITIFNE
jgi:hypothetical protein